MQSLVTHSRTNCFFKRLLANSSYILPASFPASDMNTLNLGPCFSFLDSEFDDVLIFTADS